MRTRSLLGAAFIGLTLLVTSASPFADSVLVVNVGEALTGAFVPNAEVILPALRRIAFTDSLGEAAFRGIPAGDHRVRVRKFGYAPAEVMIRVTGDTASATFLLESMRMLDTVRVTADAIAPHLTDFERRRRMALGRFLTARDLVLEGDRPFTMVAASRFRGVRVVNGQLVIGSDHRGGCPVRVLLDGMDMFQEDMALLVRTWDLDGAEFYSGPTIPAQYREGRGSCGVILLWSKR